MTEDRRLDTEGEIDAIQNQMEIERIEEQHAQLVEKRRLEESAGTLHDPAPRGGEASPGRSLLPVLVIAAIGVALVVAVVAIVIAQVS